VADDARITTTNQVMGTPAYMAPEQAAGAAVDHRADLFSLGGVLYRMLTGRPPFPGATAFEVIHALATTTPPPPTSISPGVPAPLSDLTMRLLAKVMADRPQTADEVVVVLGLVAAQPARPADEPIPLVREAPPAVHPRRGGSTPALPVARLI